MNNKIKKIAIWVLTTLYILSSFWFIQNSYASTWDVNKVKVTEKIPWANCKKNEWEKLYTCTTSRWFSAIMEIMWKLLKYITFLSWLFAVLALVVWWVMYSMWWANEAMKTKAKDYIQTSLIWLILLLLSWTILYMIAPWIFV